MPDMIIILLGFAFTIVLLACEGVQDIIRKRRGLPPLEAEDAEDDDE